MSHFVNKNINVIKQILFENGDKKNYNCYKKWLLTNNYKVKNTNLINYNIVLSAEEKTKNIVLSNSNSLIRIKNRISFIYENCWRIDLTIARQILGSDAQKSLHIIVKKMFKDNNFIQSINPDLYQFEIEIEHINKNKVTVESLNDILNKRTVQT